jgi:hypothetical protein
LVHVEGDCRVAFGRDYDAAYQALVRILEPEAERIVMAGEVKAGELATSLRVPSCQTVATVSA